AEDERTDFDKELVIDESTDKELDFDRLEALSRDWDHLNEGHRPSRNGLDEESDKKHDAMQNMPSRPESLQEYLSHQLSFLDVKPDQLALLRYLIIFLDEKGYLTTTLEEIAKSYEQQAAENHLEEKVSAGEGEASAQDGRPPVERQPIPLTPWEET